MLPEVKPYVLYAIGGDGGVTVLYAGPAVLPLLGRAQWAFQLSNRWLFSAAGTAATYEQVDADGVTYRAEPVAWIDGALDAG